MFKNLTYCILVFFLNTLLGEARQNQMNLTDDGHNRRCYDRGRRFIPKQVEELVFRLRERSRGSHIVKAAVLIQYSYLYDMWTPGL